MVKGVTRQGTSILTVVAMSLGYGVVQLDVSVVNVAIRPIGDALGGGVTALQWIVSAYTIMFAAFILSAGALGDRIGARRVFVAGFVLFTGASALCGLAPSFGVLIGARALQGLGAAVLVPCSLILLNHTYQEPEDRARAIGMWAAGASIGLSGGPVVGGVLIATLGWRAIFFINVPLGAIAIWLTLRYATETPRARDRSVDLPGQLTAVIALASLAAATIEGGTVGWTQPGILAGYAISIAALLSFLRIESRRRSPLLPLVLFRRPTFSASAAMGLVLNIAFYGFIFELSLYFQREQGRSPLETGLAFAPMTGIVLATNLTAGRFARLFGTRRVIIVSAMVAAGAFAALLGVGRTTPYLAVVVQMVLLGASLGMIVPLMTSEILGSVDRSYSGVASGTLNTARQTGSVIGVALFGSLIGTAASRISGGIHTTLVISVGLMLCTVALAMRLAPEPAPASAPQPDPSSS
jgi:DHA2 family methylenomycin A resistance protein-like MFS transporter